MKRGIFNVWCPNCKGEGGYELIYGDEGVPTVCPDCNGTGTIDIRKTDYEIEELISTLLQAGNNEALRFIES